MNESDKEIEIKRNVGRPTDLKKDSYIKVRVDSETLQSIDKALEGTNQNRSEAIREILPSISSKDFENSISLSSLRRLEKYSIDFENLFEDSNIELDNISENYPVFVFESKDPILYIKYPTYKLRILSDTKHDDLSKILSNVDGISSIYETQCALLNPSNPREYKSKFLLEVMCLKNNLDENEILKNDICLKLDSENIRYEVWPGYYLKDKEIKIQDINGKKYISKRYK